jgi:hypothetical protein
MATERMRALMPALLALLPLAAAAGDDGSPEAVATAFTVWEIDVASDGTQTEEQLRPVRELLSDELHALLLAVERRENECIAVAPADEKPVMLDGNIFHRYVEGASALDGVQASVKGGEARVQLQLRYVDANAAADSPHRVIEWQETLLLRHQQRQWRIVDIEFEPGLTLVDGLNAFLEAGCDS